MCQSDPLFPDELNTIYAHFEFKNTMQAQRLVSASNSQTLQLTTAEVQNALTSINPCKDAGPDKIPAQVLKSCAEQLKDIFTDILNISLCQAVVPICLKSATIMPVPKKPNPAGPSDFRPVALMPIVMKCFECLVMQHIKICLPADLDHLQFACRTNRCTEDAISTLYHLTLSYLEQKNTYARLLFINFSSAFNTIIPQQLVEKLQLQKVDNSTCNWVYNFLIQRQHTVRVGSRTLKTITVSTGSPQGCVPSPMLFSQLTYDCTARFCSIHILMFTDDATVVGLIKDNNESACRE